MRVRGSFITGLLIVAVALVAYGGVRRVLTYFYPLSYQTIIFEQAGEYGLDPYLVAAVIRAESRFRPGATSPEGARGLMQIMPETGKWVADQMGIPFDADSLYDPEYNIRLGCWYLANLLREFSGDPVVALAAYNGGRSNVRRWLDEKRWTGEHHTLDQIPFKETREYVAIVLRDHRRYLWIYRPLDYGDRGAS